LAKKKRKRSTRVPPRSTRDARPLPAAPPDRPTLLEWAAILALAGTLASTALLVDPRAHASFDAPKRLAALVGISLAAVAAAASARRPLRSPVATLRSLPLSLRVALLAVAAGLAWFALAAVASPRRAVSIDALRVVALTLLAVPLGASRAFERGRAILAGAFLAVTAANAAISVLQARGVRLFLLQTFGTRNETGALAGNVGYLAITVALAAILALGLAFGARSSPVRWLCGAAVLVFVAALVVNRNLTALVSLLAGVIALLVVRFGRRSIGPLAAAAALLGIAVLAAPPLRGRAVDAFAAVRDGDWDRLTTYRTGAWAAAVEMARERPVLGWGPGTYAAEFVPHRLSADLRAQRRHVNPLVTSSYSEAHCDYLQAFAEAGAPGGLVVLVAVGALGAALVRRAREDRSDAETAILIGFLLAGGIAALTWFPFQRPISAVPLLLAAGRAARLAAGPREEPEAP
jgi:O-antigen ligase